MPDLPSTILQMREDGEYHNLATNPRLQFGPDTRPFLGPTLLPERLVPQNEYREENVRFRTVIASDNTRYSPPILRNGDIMSSMLVELGESDTARSLTGQVYDAIVRYLGLGGDIQAVARLLGWNDTALIQALLEFNEKQRWETIEKAQVTIKINGTTQVVRYLDPPGARFTAGGNWSDDAYDPFDDIDAGVQQLSNSGYPILRIISTRKVTGIMSRNAKIAQRAGRIVLAGGDLSVQSRTALTMTDLNSQMGAEDWPEIERYDRRYHTETGSARYISDDVMILVGETNQREEMEADGVEFSVENTLGYVGIGRPAGESQPGRVLKNWAREDKPPRVDGQAWQTSLSVLTAPAAVVVIKGIQ